MYGDFLDNGVTNHMGVYICMYGNAVCSEMVLTSLLMIILYST